MAVRYRAIATGQADGSGRATFTFQAPPTNIVYTGSLAVLSGPAGSLATVTIGGVQWGAWTGNATFGPVQQFASEEIDIVVTGLTAGATYSCAFIGQAENEENVSIVWPSALATSLTSTTVSNIQSAAVATDEATSSAAYTDLATVGPALTMTTGVSVLVILSADIDVSNSSNSFMYMGVAVSGGTIIAATDAQAAKFDLRGIAVAGDAGIQSLLHKAVLINNLIAGSNTFTAKYRDAQAVPGFFTNRVLTVVPL